MSSNFGDVIGQNLIKTFFLNSIRRNKVSHAYVIEGDEGMGKKLLANTFANYLVCSTNEACGECEACKLAKHSSHPDIVIVTPEKSQIGVDDIRQVVKTISIKPYMSSKKVIIIPDADGMTNGAQNALLKVLEEPPSYVVFLLLVRNAQLLLDTILSRVLKLTLLPYTEKEVALALERAGKEGNTHETNIGRALALAGDEKYLSLRKECMSQIEALTSKRRLNTFDVVGFFDKNKEDISEILKIMMGYFRDIMFIKIGRQDILQNKDKMSSLISLADKMDFGGAFMATQYIIEAQKMQGSNVNFTILTTALANNCWEVLNGRDSRGSF